MPLICTFIFFRIQISIVILLHMTTISEQKHWGVKMLEHQLSSSLSRDNALFKSNSMMLSKILLSTFMGFVSKASHIAQATENSMCTGVGIHTITPPWKISLTLFLEHYARGIDTVQMSFCLYIFALRKSCCTSINITWEPFCWSPSAWN